MTCTTGNLPPLQAEQDLQEKENQDAAKKVLNGNAPNKHKSVSKAATLNENEISDIEMMEIENSEEEKAKPKSDSERDDGCNDEEELRVGDDRQMSNESGDEVQYKNAKASLIGDKRKREDLEEEEEDMDFEAIESEMKK